MSDDTTPTDSDHQHAARYLCIRALLVGNELDGWRRLAKGDAELTAKIKQVDALLEAIYEAAKQRGYLTEESEA